jgi:hypothetical protein
MFGVLQIDEGCPQGVDRHSQVFRLFQSGTRVVAEAYVHNKWDKREQITVFHVPYRIQYHLDIDLIRYRSQRSVVRGRRSTRIRTNPT